MKRREWLMIFLILSVVLPQNVPAEIKNSLSEEKQKSADMRQLVNSIIKPRTVSLTIYDIYDYRQNTPEKNLRHRETGSGTFRIRGSGEIIGCSETECLILTAGHMVAGGKIQVDIRFANGWFVQKAEVLHNLQRYDYSLIFVRFANNVPPEYVNIRLGLGEVSLMDSVIVAGYMMRGEEQVFFSAFRGEINTDIMADNTMIVSAPVTAGSSGSGVWNTNGEFVGLITSFGVVMLRDQKMASPGSGLMTSAQIIFEDAARTLREIPNCARCKDALMFIANVRVKNEK